jgi:hypothetical protein
MSPARRGLPHAGLAGGRACPTNAGRGIVGRAILPGVPSGDAFQAALSGSGRACAPGTRRLKAAQRAPRSQDWLPHVGPAAACLLLALLLAPAAHAQFDLFLVVGGAEQAAPAVYDFGSLYADESGVGHFRLRNTSSAAATVNVLTVAGVGFKLTSPTALPVGLAPQGSIDFAVSFSAAGTGAYSAALDSDGIAILLTATVAPRLTYRIDPSFGTAFPGPLDFGIVIRGSAAQRLITIQNETTLILTVPAIFVQGTDFALLGTVPSGQALGPRQGGEFTIVFTPHSIGVLQGSLTLGDRSYPLLGTGTDPPLPNPTVLLDLNQAASAQQGSLIVRFDAPAQTSGTGIATLDFHGPADSAIAFAAGGRSVAFPIAPGDLQAVLPFQTGTSAGVITFTVQIGGSSGQQSVTIAAAPPGITTAQAVRSGGTLAVSITGFDNTRSLGALTFTFYDAAGNPITPGAIRTDATADFAQYFAGSGLGGVFLLRAEFPVTGNSAMVASCEATLANSAGSTKTQRTSF